MLIAPPAGGHKRHFLRPAVLRLTGILTSCSTLDGRRCCAVRCASDGVQRTPRRAQGCEGPFSAACSPSLICYLSMVHILPLRLIFFKGACLCAIGINKLMKILKAKSGSSSLHTVDQLVFITSSIKSSCWKCLYDLLYIILLAALGTLVFLFSAIKLWNTETKSNWHCFRALFSNISEKVIYTFRWWSSIFICVHSSW